MKEHFISAALVISICAYTYSQDCEWKEKKKDTFTNATYLKSKNLSKVVMGERPAPDASTFISGYLDAANKTVSLSIVYTTTQELKIKKISKPSMMIKLADGTMLTLSSDNEFDITSLPKNHENQSVLIWNITRENLKKLAASGISAMRISFGSTDYTYQLKELHTNEFLKMFGCMDKEI